jgi:hypothetical protein
VKTWQALMGKYYPDGNKTRSQCGDDRWFQPALSRTPARKNFCGSTASPPILVS